MYSRITGRGNSDEALRDIMFYWNKLNEFGKRHRQNMRQINSDQIITPAKAASLLEKFKYDELWYELTEKQQERNNWYSTVNTILHRRTGWKHAAQAILQNPLPMLRKEKQSDYFPEHIESIEQFAQELKTWLQCFASSLCKYKKSREIHKGL